MTKYEIIQYVDGEFITTSPTDIYAWCDVAGVVITGINTNLRQRAELQGQPRLAGFCGPMWGGDRCGTASVIRYEDQRSNDILST